ncbi:motility associated factor glycosyltransferase family protein [Psychrobacillus sp. NPDC096623]|uniref:motility associated factor glycosyltransferase family protein n=1 Tax=Psychrobacillus sp. NPDC096623 TaxID=3364492 RepID=UPI00381328A5
MNWSVELAKDGDYTLKLNDIYIYSKYKPIDDAYRFILSEKNRLADKIFLVGLGLGYHLKALLDHNTKAEIYVLVFDVNEFEMLEKYGDNTILQNERVHIISLSTKEDVTDIITAQIIIPIQWIKAIGSKHKLTDFLEDIKLRQMSFDVIEKRMENNFEYTTRLNHPTVSKYKDAFTKETACLVSSGPSLEDTIHTLKKFICKAYIICMGSTLKMLLAHDLTPDAVVISDAKEVVKHQLLNTNYTGRLFYSATASKEALELHMGPKIVLYQQGYEASESLALKREVETLSVGGSVATLGFSLANYLGFENIILFGQDLGFKGVKTHASLATSGVQTKQAYTYKKVLANSGEFINASRSLNTYYRWFQKNVPLSKSNVFNTAWNGAKIRETNYISPKKLEEWAEKLPITDFEKLFK